MFDPFRDYETRGYLRNHDAEQDIELVKVAEHELFRATVVDAVGYLAKRKRLTYSDFLQVHAILFGGIYPWAGKDRAETAPDLAIFKGDVSFAHPADARRAVDLALNIAQDKKSLQQRAGEVMGLFAYGHPFLEGNGRTMLVVHWELCYRAGFAIDWSRTTKSGYLQALTHELAAPNDRVLDAYLAQFMMPANSREDWAASVPNLTGLDGRTSQDTVVGQFDDPAVAARYHEFEKRRGYVIGGNPTKPPPG